MCDKVKVVKFFYLANKTLLCTLKILMVKWFTNQSGLIVRIRVAAEYCTKKVNLIIWHTNLRIKKYRLESVSQNHVFRYIKNFRLQKSIRRRKLIASLK